MPLEFALQHRGRFSSPNPWKKQLYNLVTLTEELGIATLPKQRCLRIGETGLGKTTFINTLFSTDLNENIVPKAPQKTNRVEVIPNRFELQEEDVTLHLTVIDTPGFGDQLNRGHDLDPLLNYIDTQFENYRIEESAHNHRSKINDTRVHALLYFIQPGSGLRNIDTVILKELSEKVNIIPVLAKADTMMPEEKIWNKKLIMNQIEAYGIKLYPTDYCDEKELINPLLQHVPFAVMGSQNLIDKNGNQVRGRKYRWGIVEVDNPNHCDFVHLQSMLMNTCLHDIIESTHNTHYALYRARKLRNTGRPESILECDDAFNNRVEGRKQNLSDELVRIEEEIRHQFVQEVKSKENALRLQEEQLHQKGQQIMADYERERKKLEAEEREIDALLAQRSIMPNPKMFNQ